MIRKLVIVGLILCAQSLGAESLSVGEAVQKTLAYSPYLQARQTGEKVAGKKIDQARAMKSVRVSVGAMESSTDSPLMAFGSRLNQARIGNVDFDPARLNNPDQIGNINVGAQVTLPIYLGGMDVHARKAAEQSVGASRMETAQAREEIIFQAIKTYLGAILARESLAVAKKAVDASSESVRNAQAAVDSQRAVLSDLLQAKVHHSQNEESLLRRQNQQKLALESLATVMGVQEADEFDLTMPFLKQECVACKEEPKTLLSKALSQRPDFLKVARDIDATSHMERMHRGALRPRVVLGGAAEQNRKDISDNGHSNQMVFARVDWNVIDGGEARAKASESKLQQIQLSRMEEALRDRIFLEIREAVTNINNALERIRVSELAVGQSRESLRILRDRYSAGLAIMSDVLGAETAMLSHEMNHLQALYDYALSKAGLKMALGELTPEHCEILQAGK